MAFLKTTIQLRRDTAANWEAVKDTFIPKAGEVCITLYDAETATPAKFKIGDGTRTWGAIEYNTSTVDGNSVTYTDSGAVTVNGFSAATEGQIAYKDSTGKLVWKDLPEVVVGDDKSIATNSAGDFEIKGYDAATVGQVPSKTADGTAWITPISESDVDTKINEKISTLYHFVSSIQFANLPEPAANNVGSVYNIKDAFTTTDKFLEGAGVNYEAGSNVVIVSYENGDAENPATEYAYDVLGSAIDVAGIEKSAQDAVYAKLAGNVVSDVVSVAAKEDNTALEINITKFNGVDDTGAITTTPKAIEIPVATDTVPGLLSPTDKTKIDDLPPVILAGITINGVAATVTDGVAEIPLATDTVIGVVKGSAAENAVAVGADGVMTVNSVNVNKLTQTDGEEFVLDGGSSVG